MHVLNAANPALELLGALLRGLLLLLDQSNLVVDGVQLLLQHAGQGLGVSLAAGGEQVGHHALAVVRVGLHAHVVAPVVGVEVVVALVAQTLVHIPPKAGRRASGKAAEARTGLVPCCGSVCNAEERLDCDIIMFWTLDNQIIGALMILPLPGQVREGQKESRTHT